MKKKFLDLFLNKLHSFFKNSAVKFVILLGIVSLFSDMVYEGARSVTGPYLGMLGASGAVVGFVAGFGELIGNALRIVSGYLVDRTLRYWLFTFLGYLLLFAIPLLAFAGNWQVAAVLIIIERVGKAIRVPARDAMLSYATQKLGRGFGFGVHQTLDQLGGVLGPLIFAAVVFFKYDYRLGFLLLFIPACISLVFLFLGKMLYPHPQHLEVDVPELTTTKIPALFWVYLAGAGLLAAGYADFPLIAFHFQKSAILTPVWIPIFYIISMGASAVSALLFGLIYDRYGCVILIIAALLSSLFAPFVFLGNFDVALLGMILWGIGMGAQRSLLKAVVGDMVSKKMRGSAYGIFNTGYGIAWFLGSWLIGILYDVSIDWLIVFSVVAQLSAIPFIYFVQKKMK
ncbi:MAG: MFS transporter [Gammaproteobacteria bacterium]|nr:MFS transporter [Gammaproteobacteria bacterium]